MAEKRNLELENLNQAITEAESLLESGYEQAGNWNLAQCCGHLNLWLSYAMDGYPKAGFMAPVLWLMKLTMGKKMLNGVLKDGFKSGLPTMPKTVPSPDAAADQEAFAQLKANVERFNTYTGTIATSPLYGVMDRETVERLHIRHCEHHLSFLVPKS